MKAFPQKVKKNLYAGTTFLNTGETDFYTDFTEFSKSAGMGAGTGFFRLRINANLRELFFGVGNGNAKKKLRTPTRVRSLKKLKKIAILFGGLNRRNLGTFVLRARFSPAGTAGTGNFSHEDMKARRFFGRVAR